MDNDIEIDLKKYIQLLIHRWLWIIGFAAIAAVVAFAVSSLKSVTYEATTLIAVTQPRSQLNFDPKYQTIYTAQPNNKAFLDLASSDDVLKQVYDQWTNRPNSVKDFNDFRDNTVRVENGSDLSIIKLSVTVNNAEEAAQLANQWASIFVNKANEIYFGKGLQLRFLESQMSSAQTDLDNAEEALVDFQARNQMNILTNQLNSALQAQNEYLDIQRNMAYLEQNVQGLRSQLAASQGEKATTAEQLSALLLQFQAYNNQINTTGQLSQSGASNSLTSSNNSLPLQIQVTDSAILGELSPQAQSAILDNLAKSIQNRSAQIDSNLKTLAPQILSLQQAVEQYRVTQDQLLRKRDVARDTYTTLVNKVNETSISDQDPINRLQLASSAIPPSLPVPRNRVRNALLGGVVGGFLAVIWVLFLEWWRVDKTPEVQQKSIHDGLQGEILR